VCDSTVDTFDYHINLKFILHKIATNCSAFVFSKPLRQFTIRHFIQICWQGTGLQPLDEVAIL